MRVALVHELLTMRGGAERVLRVLADMFPDAPIYTLLYNEKKLGTWFPSSRVRTSNLQPIAHHLTYNHHLYLPFFPRAVEAWDFSEFDLVIGSSSAFVHGIITNKKPKHLCLINAPARYLWDRTHDILERTKHRPLGFLTAPLASALFHRLRTWDAETADRPDALLATSKAIQRRIQLYWRRESTVVHPPIDDHWFHTPTPVPPTAPANTQTRTGYLVVSTLAPYKRIDLAIEACNQMNAPLTVVGSGSALAALQHLAGPTISFLGHQDDAALRSLYSNAKATLFPGDEDFGLVPLESQACGTPVIAYRSGGALETIIEGVTGEFFDDPTPASLVETMRRAEHKNYSLEKCRSNAQKFSKSAFEQQIYTQIASLGFSTPTTSQIRLDRA